MTKSKGLLRARGERDKWAAAHQGRHICACGCGGVIPVRREHIHSGIPRFLWGHNATGKRRGEVKVQQLCECGCGALASPGRRFVSGHNGRGKRRPDHVVEAIRASKTGAANPRYGKHPHNFKGRTIHRSGYVLVHVDDHPFGGAKRQVMEHRLVVEAYLREHDPEGSMLVDVDGTKYLRPEIEVHHIDGVKDHNVIENLRPMTKAEHAAHHGNFKRLNASRKS